MRNRINRRAFTLIEILIVVVILGILAAIVIPQFTEASDDAAQSATKSTLQTVRAQLELYNFKTGSYPAAVASTIGNGDMPTILWTGTPSYLQQEPVGSAPYTFHYVFGTPGVFQASADGGTTLLTW